jgi:pimeloyl-ACP methyl ester carboxylesterase
MRGRGQSEYDSNHMNYNLMQESQDILAILTHEQINDVVIIGTSRGGMQATMLAGMIGSRLKGVILNDIGCVIPITALIRLQDLFAKNIAFVGDYDTALALFYKNDNDMTKNLTKMQEITIINQIFTHKEGNYYLDYDFKGLGEACGVALEHMKKINPFICNLKPLFQSLTTIPTILLQGENSDILPNDALEETKLLLPHIKIHSFNNRGHVLYFNEPEVIKICDDFLDKCI